MEATPRTNSLYRQIAKDYNPKAAEMNICKYIQGLEERLQTVEMWIKAFESAKPEIQSEEPPKKRGPKPKSDILSE